MVQASWSRSIPSPKVPIPVRSNSALKSTIAVPSSISSPSSSVPSGTPPVIPTASSSGDGPSIQARRVAAPIACVEGRSRWTTNRPAPMGVSVSIEYHSSTVVTASSTSSGEASCSGEGVGRGDGSGLGVGGGTGKGSSTGGARTGAIPPGEEVCGRDNAGQGQDARQSRDHRPADSQRAVRKLRETLPLALGRRLVCSQFPQQSGDVICLHRTPPLWCHRVPRVAWKGRGERRT